MLTVKSVNISEKKGTVKIPAGKIVFTAEGIEGDAHAGSWNRQVSMLGTESIRKFEKEAGRKIGYGEFAENITTTGMNLAGVHPLDRFISGELVLEVTQIGKKCHGKSCSIFTEVGDCIMPKEGIFCRVVSPGILKPGDAMEYSPKVFTVHVITLSDRASRGEYEDLSGPKIKDLVENFFSSLHLPSSVFYSLIPDDPSELRKRIRKFTGKKADIIFTTGGTGIGPRDITPDVIRPMLDKEIPGIMEMIRLKYGKEKPGALLSRSIAGITGQTLVYALPGSARAAGEYFAEISKTLLHSIFMMHRIDLH
jgi:molybdenum cofactor synthesis domain-containing protein